LTAAFAFNRSRTDVKLNPKGSIRGRSIVIAGLTLNLILASADIAGAQQAAIRRVGVFSDAAPTGPLVPEWLEAFRGGLREHGWVEGRNVSIDFRESRTREERPEAVALLLRTKPEVIVTNPVGAFVFTGRGGRPSASQPWPGWSPVRDIPIVFVGQSDPVAVGLVDRL